MTYTQIASIASICHEANRQYCRTIGDSSQEPWSVCPQWQKDSAILGVEKIASGETTRPEQSHESWSRQKIEDGWMYGEVKDPIAKTHHCLVPFTELPVEQQMKDHLFFAVASTLLKQI